MFYNIKSWGSSGTSSKLTIDGIEKTGISLKTAYVLDGTDLNTSHSFFNTSACIHDNKVHVVGGNYDGEDTNKHFVIEDNEFKYVDDVPIDSPIVTKIISFGGKIHAFFSQNKHYTWSEEDGWVEQEILPFQSSTISPVVYQNDLFLFEGTGYGLYKYQTEGFVKKDTHPIYETDQTASDFKVVSYNRKIHVFGPYMSLTHYTWDYTNGFVKMNDLPTANYYNPIVADSKFIYILGNGENSNETDQIFIFNGKEWNPSGMYIPYKIDGGCAVHDGEKISYLIGGNTTDNTTKNLRKLFKKIYIR